MGDKWTITLYFQTVTHRFHCAVNQLSFGNGSHCLSSALLFDLLLSLRNPNHYLCPQHSTSISKFLWCLVCVFIQQHKVHNTMVCVTHLQCLSFQCFTYSSRLWHERLKGTTKDESVDTDNTLPLLFPKLFCKMHKKVFGPSWDLSCPKVARSGFIVNTLENHIQSNSFPKSFFWME